MARVLLLLAVAVAMVACGGSATRSPTTSPRTSAPDEPSATPRSTPRQSASPTAVASEAPPVAAVPRARVQALQAALPDRLAGTDLRVRSFDGDNLSDLRASSYAEFVADGRATFDFLGRSGPGLSVAVARAPELDIAIAGVVLAGIDGGQVKNEWLTSAEESAGEEIAWQMRSVGGKDVTVGSNPAFEALGPIYLYSVGDQLFFVQTSDEDLAGKALRKLP